MVEKKKQNNKTTIDLRHTEEEMYTIELPLTTARSGGAVLAP